MFVKTVCHHVKMVVFILACALANQLLQLAQQIFLKNSPTFAFFFFFSNFIFSSDIESLHTICMTDVQNILFECMLVCF